MTRGTKRPKPPKHLRAATRRWWQSVVDEYDLEPHHIQLLTLAAEAWDRCGEAREALAEHGTIYADRFGQPRSRPEVSIERDSRIAFARLVRELALDVNEPAEDSRPPGIRDKAGLKVAEG
ncbi:MAG: hypothetical protein JXQ75_00505 [Phycisphaerae bacterium]|nr:hypothetical protein [Phycisphaerae bacterium]